MITKERDYYKTQFENLKHVTAIAAQRSSNASLPTDLHVGGHGGQLDLSLAGAQAAAAAAAEAHRHDDYKRDVPNGYPNNNDLKLGTLR